MYWPFDKQVSVLPFPDMTGAISRTGERRKFWLVLMEAEPQTLIRTQEQALRPSALAVPYWLYNSRKFHG